LKAAGCDKIYSEKVSAKSIDKRSQFQKLMRDVLPGAVVVIAKLDRLCRSTRDLLNILSELSAQQCGFVSLGESWCDTTTSVGRLMMTIMSGIAEFERELIQVRTGEGLARAKVAGGRRIDAALTMLDSIALTMRVTWINPAVHQVRVGLLCSVWSSPKACQHQHRVSARDRAPCRECAGGV
jgi:DNA invertase Pin-like site-specific DNA recombinase